MTSSSSHNYKHLTPDDVSHFLEHGWLKVPGAIKGEYIDKWMEDMWARVGYDEHDKSTWTDEYLHLPRHREVPAEEFCPEAWNKITEICGGLQNIDPVRERYYGDAFIINFGSEARTNQDSDNKPEDSRGWHIDDDWYRMFLDSSGNALTVIHCFTDIPERGGGTWLCEDGIEGIVDYLYKHRQGLDPPEPRAVVQHVPECKKFVSVVAKKGDVLLLHGLLPHTNSPNYLHYARVISNPHVCLHSPHNLNRPDGNYNLLEQVILDRLGRDSLPEYAPERERMFWYPRNAGFKRAKVQDELKRMKAFAVSQGRSEDSVDSVYLGPKDKLAEFERRNGFDKPINEASGLEMQQHGEKSGPAPKVAPQSTVSHQVESVAPIAAH